MELKEIHSDAVELARAQGWSRLTLFRLWGRLDFKCSISWLLLNKLCGGAHDRAQNSAGGVACERGLSGGSNAGSNSTDAPCLSSGGRAAKITRQLHLEQHARTKPQSYFNADVFCQVVFYADLNKDISIQIRILEFIDWQPTALSGF